MKSGLIRHPAGARKTLPVLAPAIFLALAIAGCDSGVSSGDAANGMATDNLSPLVSPAVGETSNDGIAPVADPAPSDNNVPPPGSLLVVAGAPAVDDPVADTGTSGTSSTPVIDDLLTGTGTTVVGDLLADIGTSTDSSTPADTGALPDSGTPSDGGTPPDSGTTTDGGTTTPPDVVVDSGTPPDAPVPVDPPAIVYASHVVTPSLGLVLGGTVRILALDGTELAAAVTSHTGSATLDLPVDTVGPFIVELAGNEAATYYDEALDTLAPLASGQVIRAVVADLGDVGTGVTPLTEMAVQYLEQQHGSLAGLTAEQIAAANEFVRTQLAPELTDITLPPTVVGSTADAAMLADAEADLYALKLAALARVAAAHDAVSTTPALDILHEMAVDLADGALDGVTHGAPVTPTTYDLGTFATQFLGLAQSYTSNGGLVDLLNGLSHYVSPDILALLTPPGGGGVGGDTGGGGVTLPAVPGDLLSSWAGTYAGTFSHAITNSGSGLLASTLNALLAPAMDIALGISGGHCGIGIGSNTVTIGGQTFAFDPALAVADSGGNRSFNLPGNFSISVFGITVGSSGSVAIHTAGTAPGTASVSLGASISGLFGTSASANYTGTCTLN